MRTEHHDQLPPNFEVDPNAVKLGHEPDVVKPSRILYVAAALVILFAVTYVTVTLVVKYTLPGSKGNYNNPAQARNHQPADQGMLNKRFERISSTDASADVKQPRLEGLQQFSHVNDAPYFRSSEPLEAGKNSPQYHPEDLRPDGLVAKELGLHGYRWKDKDKNRVTIPLSEAFKLAAEGSHEKEGSDSAARSLYQKWFKSDNKVQLPKYGASGSTASNPHWFGMISGDVKGHDEREPSKDKGKSFEPKGAEEKKKDSGSDSPKKTQTPGESKSD